MGWHSSTRTLSCRSTCYGRDKKAKERVLVSISMYAITLEVVQENLNYVDQSTGKKLVCIEICRKFFNPRGIV